MSHFVVIVKLTADRLARQKPEEKGEPLTEHARMQSALTEILAPFNEQDEDYLVFDDCTEAVTKEYDTGSNAEGKPFKEVYKSLATFARNYHGCTVKKSGVIGSRHNPNSKWDWWVIGGRWTGYFPVKKGSPITLGRPGTFDNEPNAKAGDVVRLANIDMKRVERETKKEAATWWKDWQRFLADPNANFGDPWSSPRERAMKLGLVRVVTEKGVVVTAGPNEKTIPWADMKNCDADRRHFVDVCTLITEKEFFAKYTACFCPIASYATLDDSGWHAPGEMGWFGMSDETADAYIAHKTNFIETFVKKAGPDDLLVAVDCHI